MKKLQKPVRKIPTQRPSLGIKTLPEMIEASAEMFGDNTAYLMPRDGDLMKLTFGEVLERVKLLSRYMKELGLGRGDIVGILGENRPEWAMAFFSISWIGATALPLDSRAPAETWKSIISFSAPRAIVLSSTFIPQISSLGEEQDSPLQLIPMDGFEDICEKYGSGVGSERVELGDLLEILFTSGTTGNPKGVMLSHRNIMSNVDDMYRIFDCSPRDRAFSILPIHHAYESTVGMLNPFNTGMSVFYGRGLKPRELAEDLKSAKPTIWLTAPLILEKLLLRIKKEISNTKGIKKVISMILPEKLIGRKVKRRLGLESIRHVVSGGAALPAWVSVGLEGLGFPLLQGYGLSEASPIITVNPPASPKNESIGMVIPSNEVEIRDTDDEGNGEIVARGLNIMKGYFKNESATKEVLSEDGWLHTGDIGYFDENGYLYITGRKKFVIVTRGGKNVFPEELEEKLCRCPLIEEALVFSPDDESIQAVIYPNGEEVIAALGKKGLDESDENTWRLFGEEIKRVNRTMEPYKRIRNYALRREEFPKTTTRKIKRHLFKGLNLSSDMRFLSDG